MYISRGVRLLFEKNGIFFNLNICFTFTNSLSLAEMQHNVAFHLGLHCLQKCSLRCFLNHKGLKLKILVEELRELANFYNDELFVHWL